MKILVIGLGNVGASLSYLLLEEEGIEELAVYDINEKILKAKYLDLSHCLGILKSELDFKIVTDLNNYDADIVVITAGKPRKTGITRFELLEDNIDILDSIYSFISHWEKIENKIFIIVTNPVDILTYYSWQKLKIDRKQVMGMSGVLDSGRYRFFLSLLLACKPAEINVEFVIGPHSKKMIVIDNNSSPHIMQKALEQTRNAGAEVVSLLGRSAYFAPAQAIKMMIKAMLNDEKKVLPVVAVLNGEYGYHDIAFGVPVVLGKNGIEKVIEIELSQQQKQELADAISDIQEGINWLRKKGRL